MPFYIIISCFCSRLKQQGISSRSNFRQINLLIEKSISKALLILDSINDFTISCLEGVLIYETADFPNFPLNNDSSAL